MGSALRPELSSEKWFKWTGGKPWQHVIQTMERLLIVVLGKSSDLRDLSGGWGEKKSRIISDFCLVIGWLL